MKISHEKLPKKSSGGRTLSSKIVDNSTQNLNMNSSQSDKNTSNTVNPDLKQDPVQGVKKVRKSIKEQLDNINRPISNTENKQIEFLERIQERIFQNLSQLTPEALLSVTQINQPPLCVECALLTLQTLFQIDNQKEGDFNWKDLQQSLRNREKQFIKCLYSYQNLTINHQFQRQNIIKAKNHLLRYIVEEQLMSKENIQYDPKISNIVNLAENIVGFIEVYDALIKSLILDIPQQEFKVEQKEQKIVQVKRPELTQIEQPNDEIQVDIKKDKIQDTKEPETQQITAKKTPKYHYYMAPLLKAQPSTPVNKVNKSLDPKIKEIIKSPRLHQPKLINVHSPVKRVKSANPKNETFKHRDSLQDDIKLETESISISESLSKSVKLNQNKKSTSFAPQSAPQIDLQSGPLLNKTSCNDLQKLIETNRANIKQLMSEQNELNQKIERETQSLQGHMDELIIKDQIQVKSQQDKQQSDLKPKQRAPIQKQQTSPQQQPKSKQPVTQKKTSKTTNQVEKGSIEALRSNIQQSENDRVNLENELNRLLKIIDDKAKIMPDQYSQIKTNLQNNK